MIRSRSALLLLLLALCSTTTIAWAASNLVPRDQGDRNEKAVLRYLRPILKSSGTVARIYYRTDCQADDDYPIPFPKLLLRAPNASQSVSAIPGIFPHNKKIQVTINEPGLVRIRIENFPEALLHIKISSLALKPVEQYDVQSAFRAIENTVEFQQALRKFGIRGIPRPYNLPVQSPAEGLPHLPPSLTNVTVDRALDLVAKTFDIVVVWGYCESPPTYDLTYTGTQEW